MKSSQRLKQKRAQRQKARQQKINKIAQPKEEENKKEKITKQSKKKAILKQTDKSLLSLSIVRTQKGKQVTIHSKYEIEASNPFFNSIESLVKALQQKEKKKNPKILSIIQYSNFPNFQFTLRGVKPQDEKCCICQYEFETITDYEKQLNNEDDNDVLHLNCTHLMHKACFQQLMGDKHWIKCPLCYVIYGEMTGDQPKGTMTHRIQKNMQCDGYPKGTIVIQYRFPDGQRQGVHYSGTGRTAYLPTTSEGYQVFQLLKKAFDRRLTFTIGRSVTTGMDNQVVWNGIHHKTHTHGGSSHFGYPDPTYFSRVKLQLAMKGVQ